MYFMKSLASLQNKGGKIPKTKNRFRYVEHFHYAAIIITNLFYLRQINDHAIKFTLHFRVNRSAYKTIHSLINILISQYINIFNENTP